VNKVFLDANVLYSNAVRSLLVWLHINRAVHVFWTEKVWEEAFGAFAKHNGDQVGKQFRASMVNNLLTLYPECMVRDYSDQDHGLTDNDDNHVVSAVLKAEAETLLTFDLRLIDDCQGSFPFTAINPDNFLVQVVNKQSPLALKQSVLDHFQSLTNSKPSWFVYVGKLRQSGLVEFSKVAEGFKQR
jgi:predicted nucleic acid-binding protein